MKSRPFAGLSLLGDLLTRARRDGATLLAVCLAFIVSLAAVLLATEFRSLGLPPAAAWTEGALASRDYVVERDFLYTDQKATEIRREAAARLVPPVFTMSPSAGAAALDDLDRFSQDLLRHQRAGEPENQVFRALQEDFPDRLSRADLHAVLSTRNPPLTLQHARALLQIALAGGILDMVAHADEAQAAGQVELRTVADGRLQSEMVPLKDVVTRDNAADMVQLRLVSPGSTEAERAAVGALIRAFAAENAFYDDEASRQRRERARAQVDPVTEKLSRGEVVVRRGDLVTPEAADRIRSLTDSLVRVDVNGIVGESMFLLAVFLVAAYLLSMKSTPVPLRRGHVLLLLSLGLAYVVIAALVVRFVGVPDWMPASVVLPTGAMTMLVAILVSTPAGVFFSLAASLALLPLTGMSIQAFLFAFLSGLGGTAVVLDAEKRIDLVRAGLFLSLAEAGVLVVLGLLGNYQPRMVLSLVGAGMGNGFLCGILALGFLPVFELILNAPTRFKLMELSDLNSPVFKRMLSLAPGTYTHSISVANLAETACEAIGANALLARVSAYYHDIGKVDQADYFVENQKARNRHDEMRPSLSVAVIKSHVRIGIEKARELNLPQAIIDIIAQHHGRGLITYFYHRAVKEGRDPRVSKDDYTYPGSRPKSREAAVLMLADTVEAACRALKRPTESRLEQVVQDMIMEKFNSGDLSDSNLTLRDLELIRRSFVHILEGQFHARIEYPKLTRTAGRE
ncbi:MAG TPA: HDIG domain-containing protein [Spirochaetia bacterium]|nr:HDIG domain-containing protein [Spirochaetia bacterium]